MRFSRNGAVDAEVESRASVLLEDGFLVSCWKHYDDAVNFQTVINSYEVAYTTDGTTKKWSYEGVRPGQYLHYWDIAGFPYEFRAVTPYIETTTLLPDGLTVNLSSASRHFWGQTFLEEQYNHSVADSEPCLVARVIRKDKDDTGAYHDYDMLVTNSDSSDPVEINTATVNNPVRDVNLPFHHLMSKVGFRLYVDDPMVPTSAIKLSNVSISIFNAENKYLTESRLYVATDADGGMLNGTFKQETRAESQYNLITKTGAYSGVNMADHLNKLSAFHFNCPDDMVVIPQTGLKIRAKLTLTYNSTDYEYDSLISLTGENPDGDLFTWEPNKHYVYYLHLQNLEKYPIITCTAEIVPWEVVKTEDIDIGL